MFAVEEIGPKIVSKQKIHSSTSLEEAIRIVNAQAQPDFVKRRHLRTVCNYYEDIAYAWEHEIYDKVAVEEEVFGDLVYFAIFLRR